VTRDMFASVILQEDYTLINIVENKLNRIGHIRNNYGVTAKHRSDYSTNSCGL